MDELGIIQTPLITNVENTRAPQTSLGRDDFLKILITQLQNQDPTAPMEDREFIAQMAQFSALEQMTQMSGDFQELSGMLQSQNALGLLGQRVTVDTGNALVEGVVNAVSTGGIPQVQINGHFYEASNITMVHKGVVAQ